MKILVTGCAGFIGYFLTKKLLEKKSNKVFGVDNLNDYYDVKLKKNRLKDLSKKINFTYKKIDICQHNKLKDIFQKNKFDYVINLAAQAGVRYSIEQPKKYIDTNLLGFFNIIDLSREYKIKHLVYASSSSVYGSSENFPLKESEITDQPLSLYAATKKSNELISHSYSNIFKLPTTGIRFFTVYGPFGRPDMFLFNLTHSIVNSKQIKIFNNGNHERDFTYIDDAVSGVLNILTKPSKNIIPYNIFNIASSKPIHLLKFIKIIENKIGKKAKIKLTTLQKGDVLKTHGSINHIKNSSNFKPKVSIEDGIDRFLKWYYEYYK